MRPRTAAAISGEFRSESSIPDYKKTITDTIEALNAGVRWLRDGTEVGRIPRKAQLKDPATGKVVVTNLRLPGRYDERLLGSLGLQGPYYNWNRWSPLDVWNNQDETDEGLHRIAEHGPHRDRHRRRV